MSHSPSWRPSWKLYHPVTCLLGTALCITGMFFIDYIFALIVVGVTMLIFMYFNWSENAKNNWGEFPQSLMFTDTVHKLQRLNSIPDHVKTYRPQFEFILDFNNGDINEQILNMKPFEKIVEQAHSILTIGCIGDCINFETDHFILYWGIISYSLLGNLVGRAGGIGKVKPNIIAISFHPKYLKNQNLFDLVRAALESNLSVAIVRGFNDVQPEILQTNPIDIWWLADDGGLTVLLGYILANHDIWSKCSIRCFAITSGSAGINEIRLNLSHLFIMFRIPCEVIVLSGNDYPPSDETLNLWKELNVTSDDDEIHGKINTFLRLREMILKNSLESSLIFCTMQIPRQNQNPELWTAFIDVVSRGMPPFMWIHGNNENVLTFAA